MSAKHVWTSQLAISDLEPEFSLLDRPKARATVSRMLLFQRFRNIELAPSSALTEVIQGGVLAASGGRNA